MQPPVDGNVGVGVGVGVIAGVDVGGAEPAFKSIKSRTRPKQSPPLYVCPLMVRVDGPGAPNAAVTSKVWISQSTPLGARDPPAEGTVVPSQRLAVSGMVTVPAPEKVSVLSGKLCPSATRS